MKSLKEKAIETVNVVEVHEHDGILGLTSFPNTKVGNKAAEKLFLRIITENGCSKKGIKGALKQDAYSNGDWTIYLVPSTD